MVRRNIPENGVSRKCFQKKPLRAALPRAARVAGLLRL